MRGLHPGLKVSCFVLAAAAALAATAAVASEPVRYTVPDGVLEVSVPPGWESNPRLAQDNAVIAFFNPTGMTKGDELPIWLLVDRNARVEGTTFANQLRRILAEGKGYGFVPQDSVRVPTADGRTVFTYTFGAAGDSLHHGLGILESPAGAIILRYQAASEAIWKKQGPAVITFLKSLRFVKS